MLEVLQYLRANGFKTYIVTGGGQDFVRTYACGGLRHPSRTSHRLRGRDEYGYDQQNRPILARSRSSS